MAGSETGCPGAATEGISQASFTAAGAVAPEGGRTRENEPVVAGDRGGSYSYFDIHFGRDLRGAGTLVTGRTSRSSDGVSEPSWYRRAAGSGPVSQNIEADATGLDPGAVDWPAREHGGARGGLNEWAGTRSVAKGRWVLSARTANRGDSERPIGRRSPSIAMVPNSRNESHSTTVRSYLPGGGTVCDCSCERARVWTSEQRSGRSAR
jgi:hypothetical protein